MRFHNKAALHILKNEGGLIINHSLLELFPAFTHRFCFNNSII